MKKLTTAPETNLPATELPPANVPQPYQRKNGAKIDGFVPFKPLTEEAPSDQPATSNQQPAS